MKRARNGAKRTLRGDLRKVQHLAQIAVARGAVLLVGLAACVGFALGGGVSRRILVAAAGTGARFAADLATDGWVSRTQDAGAQYEEGNDR